MHGEPAQVNAATLDGLIRIELEAVAIKEWPGGQTGLRRHFGNGGRSQGGLDALVKAGGHPATRESGTGEKKVEITLVGIGSETRQDTVRLGEDRLQVG